MHTQYFPTGNEYVALPTINHDGEIESLNVVSMADRGLLEISGAPFLRLELVIDGRRISMAGMRWTMIDHWIPRFTFSHDDVDIEVSYVTPLDTRGWFLRVEVVSQTPHDVSLILHGNFSQLLHSINETKPCQGEIVVYESLWNQGLMFDFRTDITKLSFGFLTDGGFKRQEPTGSAGTFVLEKQLADKEHHVASARVHHIFMGLGLEEVGAATQAIHMQREGGDFLLAQLRGWLKARIKTLGDVRLDDILNRNQFFNFFYATGKTFDTEETILCTSRSPRYYVSAAYWDRDSLIWSFPALLATEPSKAREALEYVFGRQSRNVGIHSRYIDGTVLEPGFELDELCAPILALNQYLHTTTQWDYLNSPAVIAGIDHIVARLKSWRHESIDLYGTFLMPTDDMRRYAYLTYDNVLVWKMLGLLEDMFRRLGREADSAWAAKNAERVRTAVETYCVATIDGTPRYIWSTDLEGNFDVYDEPPGSLTLLAHYGFCTLDDPIFQNTMKSLYDGEFPHYFGASNFPELGCTHADHPWVLSICNSLLNGRRAEALDMLKRAPMDNLIACESIDAESGEWATGAHFATCAGFLVYALLRSAGKIGI